MLRFVTAQRALRHGRARLLLKLLGLADHVYRVQFLATASRHGVLRALSQRALTIPALMRELGLPADAREPFEIWLRMGTCLGEITRESDTIRLRGVLARAMVDPEHDEIAAMIEQFARYRHVLDALDLLRAREPLRLSDADAELVARASRIALPLIEDANLRYVPQQRGARLLELGCGAGYIMRHAASLNAELTLHGVELDEKVAIMARDNLVRWGLGSRAEVRTGDVRTITLPGDYDLITLHNNVYYFAVDERVALFARLRGMLAPGGKLVLSTACAGGSVGTTSLDLYWALAESGDRLPWPEELTQQFRAAGFRQVENRRMVPGESFHVVSGSRD